LDDTGVKGGMLLKCTLQKKVEMMWNKFNVLILARRWNNQRMCYGKKKKSNPIASL